jgi:hypothetical protein
MSGLKVGDRVRVEFEGVVESSDSGPRLSWVNGSTADGTSWTVPLSACTVLVPPIKVGDVVTADNIGQLPIGSIVCRVGETGSPAQRLRDGWLCLPGGPNTQANIYTGKRVVDWGDALVLRIGGGS